MNTAILVYPFIPNFSPQYPTGLYKIASHCSSQYKIAVLDQRITNDLYDQIDKILDNNHTLCIGISTMTGSQLLSAIEISKRYSGRVPIVWGGMHPTVLPTETIKEDYVDYVVRGEGESAFLNLLNFLSGSEIPQERHFLTKEDHFFNFEVFNEFEKSSAIDYINFPIRKEYFTIRDNFRKGFSIETSRGCPFKCAFCHNSVFRSKYRRIDNTILFGALDFLMSHYQIDGIVFQEDNFLINLRKILPIINVLQERRLKWKANGRVDVFLKYINSDGNEFISRIINSGCTLLQFGIESGENRVLSLINKGFRVEQVVELNRRLSDFPLRVRYNFIVGFPSETNKEIEKTLELIEELQRDNPKMDPPFLNLYTPYPGTPMYELALSHGFKPPTTTDGWAEFTWNECQLPWLDKSVAKELSEKSRQFRESSNYLKR